MKLVEDENGRIHHEPFMERPRRELETPVVEDECSVLLGHRAANKIHNNFNKAIKINMKKYNN